MPKARHSRLDSSGIRYEYAEFCLSMGSGPPKGRGKQGSGLYGCIPMASVEGPEGWAEDLTLIWKALGNAEFPLDWNCILER